MWSLEETRVVKAAPEKVWRLWTEVSGWNRWDAEVEWSALEGVFAVGSRGQLKPKGAPVSRFVLTEVSPGRSFSDCTRLPLASLEFIHRLEPCAEGVRVTHRVQLSGLLSGVFARWLGKNFQRGLPHAVESLARMAEAEAPSDERPRA